LWGFVLPEPVPLGSKRRGFGTGDATIKKHTKLGVSLKETGKGWGWSNKKQKRPGGRPGRNNKKKVKNPLLD